jgi:hypothetical protein
MIYSVTVLALANHTSHYDMYVDMISISITNLSQLQSNHDTRVCKQRHNSYHYKINESTINVQTV